MADRLQRWGLKTLGDLAGLPARPLSERLGQAGVMWQRLARGEDLQPLVATEPEAPIEETLDLEWPVEGLEPLSFVLARICEPIAERLAALDLAAVVLHLSCRLVSRETATRELQLPAPMRDPKVLRTLILLHLESHPLAGGVDRLTLRVDTAPARITQFSLLSRARPFPEQMATLLARLSALLGEDRVGAPALVDSHRPGAFRMARFSGGRRPFDGRRVQGAGPPREPRVALRRFRVPVPARVMVQAGRPVRVTTGRRGLDGGAVASAAGPWRTSGEWWHPTSRLESRRVGRGAGRWRHLPHLSRSVAGPLVPGRNRRLMSLRPCPTSNSTPRPPSVFSRPLRCPRRSSIARRNSAIRPWRSSIATACTARPASTRPPWPQGSGRSSGRR